MGLLLCLWFTVVDPRAAFAVVKQFRGFGAGVAPLKEPRRKALLRLLHSYTGCPVDFSARRASGSPAVPAPTSHGASKAARRCDCDCVRGITKCRSGCRLARTLTSLNASLNGVPIFTAAFGSIIAPDQFRRRRIGLVSRYLLRNARFGIDLKIATPLFLPTLLLPTHRGWPVGASVDHHVFRPASPDLIFFLNPGPVHFPRHFATSIEQFCVKGSHSTAEPLLAEEERQMSYPARSERRNRGGLVGRRPTGERSSKSSRFSIAVFPPRQSDLRQPLSIEALKNGERTAADGVLLDVETYLKSDHFMGADQEYQNP